LLIRFWSFIMDMKFAPKDRSILLFQGGPVAVLARWHTELGWISEYKDIKGEPMVAVVSDPTAWMYA
jgi:hypothetical protein